MTSDKFVVGGNEYGSHFIPLTFAALYTEGPILEMGAGHYSTPLLHIISQKYDRKLYTADTSKDWLNLFKEFESEMHELHYIPVYDDDWMINPKPEEWDKMMKLESEWGLVFIDHRPGNRRKVDIAGYSLNSQIIVVHDTEEASYGYEVELSKFKFRKDYKRFNTWTSLVSNFIDVSIYIF